MTSTEKEKLLDCFTRLERYAQLNQERLKELRVSFETIQVSLRDFVYPAMVTADRLIANELHRRQKKEKKSR